MRVNYEAEHLIDAHLVKGLLEQHGIRAWVRGEHLAGAIGGLPVGGLLAVCVDDEAEPAAREVVARFQPGDGDEPADDAGPELLQPV